MAFLLDKSLPEIILDEIGLEGLEGITISGLWIRLSDTLQLPLPLLDRFQAQAWNVILQSNAHLQFYTLPEPREKLKIWDRFAVTDPDYGLPLTLTECPYTVFKCVPISDNKVFGSCETYDIRKPIPFEEIEKLSVNEVTEKWGDTFIIVGSQALRYSCLVPPNVSIPTEITSSQYCVLEFIGRARKNGVASAGKFSLLDCCKDSAIAFYIRNKLVRLGLVTRQVYTEKRSDRLISSSLLTLTRFHQQNKTAFIAIIEKMFFALKHTPNQSMTLTKVRHLFPPENQSMIKKILLTHFFRKFFETCNVRLKDLDGVKTTPKMNLDREVVCVKLKNPNLSEDELFNDDEPNDEKEAKDFYEYKHSHVDMPLAEEIYRAIEKFGSEGCSQSQLCTILSMNHLNVRQALKKALNDKTITSYCKDMGRQRTSMLVAANCSNTVRKAKEDNIKITKNLKCDDEPKIPIDPDPPLKDITQITANIRHVTNLKVNPNLRDETAKQIERKQKIVEMVNDCCIVQVQTLRQEIIKSELESGYKDEICSKSIYRTLARLQIGGILNLFEITLRLDEHARIYRYVTHPKITIDHHVIQQEVIKLKNLLYLYTEERKFRSTNVRMGQSAVKSKVARVGLIPTGPHKAPKFLTARFLHEFMFYILFELQPSQEPLQLSEDLLKTWLQLEPNIDFVELYKTMSDEYIVPYSDQISWKTFVPPLPVYEGKPFGWISLPDVVERMPFSLLNKLTHIPPSVDPMAMDYLLHPIRQHYLLKQLPLSLQGLINRTRLSPILVNIVRVLHRMGLIQLTEKGGKDALQLWVYLNRKASIKDTTTSEAGYVTINPDREYTSIPFVFENYNDIQQYWNCLHKVCIHTKLGFVHKNKPNNKTLKVHYKVRRNELNFIVAPVGSFEEAPSLDLGIPPGDGLGAGGVASGLYSSFQRNWTWLVNNKHTAAAAAAVQKLKKTTYKRTKLSKLLTANSTKKSTGTPPTMTVKKVNRFSMTSAGRVVKRKGTIIPTKPRAYFPVDSVDRDALKQMRSLRARWTVKEDLILKMARATFLFLAVPVLHLSHRDVARVARDIIRLQCGIYNKTTQACHRRMQFLIKTNRHLPELPTWLHSMQSNDHLCARYEGDKFFRELRLLYPKKSDEPEFRNALLVHFLYAFGKLQEQIDFANLQDKGYAASKFPQTLSEFYKHYRECSPLNESNTLLHFNPTTRVELQHSTINNVLHSSLCCVRDKTQYNLQIFEVFKTYSEDLLHAAFKKARLDRLVVARKKNQIKTYTTQMTGPSYVFSNKYRLSLMFLRLPYVIFDMCHGFFDQAMQSIFSAEPSSIEIKSPHSAQLFFLGEFLWKNYIQVDIHPPSNMLTIDPTAQQSSGSGAQKILDHYRNVLEDAPQTEYLKQFDALGELATRVKFKAANEKYKLYYRPFDIVSKLNNVQIHFFCFLANLNRSLDLTFTGYDEQEDSFCPFYDCVMKGGGNYLNAIEKVVNDREGSLDIIHEDNHMETDGESDSITIGVENLMAVFEKYQSFLRDKLGKEEKKDLGRITIKRKPIDFIAICKDITKANDETTNSDEYEPTLNKEERIAKAQDVFVVHLPTLKLKANDEVNIQKKMYKGVMIPEDLMEPIQLRDEILDKVFEDTCWTYTQNNLDTLKPIMVTNGFTDEEQQKVIEIHDFIESFELGAHASDLLERFNDINFLQKAMKLLRQHYLVLRAGVSSFMYVQKNHVRHWVIHTHHIKRLARESMGKLLPTTDDSSRKRSLEDDENECTEPVAKCSKTNEEGKRVPRPVERYEDRKDVITSTLLGHNDPKDLLVLKPCPWIRVNGSINRRVLDKWMASVLIECTVQCGCTVHDICLRFKQMHSVDIMFLLELMADLKIIELRSYKRVKVGLSTGFKELEKSNGNEFTDPRDTFVIAAPDAITRMSSFIGDKLYRAEFI